MRGGERIMIQYSFACSLGHEPETMSVYALGDDEALEKMLLVAHDHMQKMHGNLPPMTEEQLMSLIKTRWTKQ